VADQNRTLEQFVDQRFDVVGMVKMSNRFAPTVLFDTQIRSVYALRQFFHDGANSSILGEAMQAEQIGSADRSRDATWKLTLFATTLTWSMVAIAQQNELGVCSEPVAAR
jgi:hypothetical protein